MCFEVEKPNWCPHFIYGGPVAGNLSQPNVYHSLDPPDTSLSDIEGLFLSAPNRFRSWRRARCQHQVFIWEEADSQVASGWAGKPIPPTDDGRLVKEPIRPVNPVYRYPSAHPGKIRRVDDLKHGGCESIFLYRNFDSVTFMGSCGFDGEIESVFSAIAGVWESGSRIGLQ